MNKEITKYAKQFMQDYESKFLRIDGRDVFNMHDTINLARLYLNGQTRDGDMEHFSDITQQIINNSKKAEDIDTKDMVIVSDSPNYFWQSMLLRGQNRKWMKKVDWGTTVNKMTEVRGIFGGLLVKKGKTNGVVDIEVMQWADAYFDPKDLVNGTKIFLMDKAEHEIRAMLNDEQKLALDKSKEEAKCYYMYGYLPKELIDETLVDDYIDQWHKLVQIGDKMYCVESELMDRNIFRYRQYQPRYGFSNPYNILGKGCMEISKFAQQMENLITNKQIDIIKVAGNVYLQGDPEAQAGALQGSTVFDLANGSELPPGYRPVDLMPGGAMTGMSNFVGGVRQNLNNNTSSQDIVSGEMPPSGTPLGSVQIVNSEARGFYDYMREDMALFINILYQDWILPDLARQLKGKDSVILEYTPEELLKIDGELAERQASKLLVEAADKGKFPKSPEELEMIKSMAKEMIRVDGKEKGNMREIMVTDLELNKAEYRVQVMITNEQRNTQAYVAAANTIATGMIQAQGNPMATKMLKKAADAIGVNETELMV